MPGTVRAFLLPKIFEGRSGRAPRAPLGHKARTRQK